MFNFSADCRLPGDTLFLGEVINQEKLSERKYLTKIALKALFIGIIVSATLVLSYQGIRKFYSLFYF